MIVTAELVSKNHPDKICDQISDAIVDACLEQDPMSRVAVETMGGHGTIVLTGEVTTKAVIDFSSIAKKVYFELTKKEIGVLTNIVKQSSDISMGVDRGGAGDQGIMIGYACNENESYVPNELFLARDLLEPFEVDAKSQVTMVGDKITDVVLSVQGKTRDELQNYLISWFGQHLLYCNKKLPNTYCNNTGAFNLGGFDADSGVTGRKIVVDAYGPRVPVGGGAFSGKDPTKVDRSGAYMARWIALNLLKKHGAKEVLVKLAYVIGKPEPIMMKALIDYREVQLLGYGDFNCRPQAIIERFDLRRPIYQQTARQGHFGYDEYPWEKI